MFLAVLSHALYKIDDNFEYCEKGTFEEIVLSSKTMYSLFWYMFMLNSPRIYNSFILVFSFSKFVFIISSKLL